MRASPVAHQLTLLAVALALMTMPASRIAVADEAPIGTLTGDWGGLRSRLKQRGLS